MRGYLTIRYGEGEDMKEKGFVAKEHEVRGILDGRQTQFRRMIKPQPELRENDCGHMGLWWKGWNLQHWANEHMEFSPFGKVGDRLYVRETFCIGRIDEEEVTDGMHDGRLYISQCKGDNDIIHRQWADDNNVSDEEVRWTPSIHMKREQSRVDLEITDIRVERLQDISESDAKAEGSDKKGSAIYTNSGGHSCHLDGFAGVWQSIYENWTDNPWVWVVEFKKI